MATTQPLSAVNYTTNNAVRGALGLTARELPDEQIDNMGLGTRLEMDLAAWVPATVSVSAFALHTSSGLEGKSFALYCTAFCAYEVCKRLPLLASLRVSDGKNEMERQPVDYLVLEEALRVDMRASRRYLETYFASLSSTTVSTTVFNPFVGVSSSFDPVTNT